MCGFMKRREDNSLVLEARGIKKSFTLANKTLEVLKDINLSLHKGEILAIVGSSGSGKSTLMNILGCLDKPSDGRYWIDGEEVSLMDGYRLARIRAQKIGFVFQRFNLLPDISAQENVVLAQLYNGVARDLAQERALELLETVGLKDWKDHFPYQMSGGQQQRVAIARALANDPEIIFADEPTGSLDSTTGNLIIELFKNLNSNQGLTLVLVTHDPKIARVANRIVKMVDGKLNF